MQKVTFVLQEMKLPTLAGSVSSSTQMSNPFVPELSLNTMFESEILPKNDEMAPPPPVSKPAEFELLSIKAESEIVTFFTLSKKSAPPL